MKKYIIGIDIGKTGGMAIFEDNTLKKVIPFSMSEYISELKGLLNTPDNSVECVIEQVHSMPRQGVKSMFSFGERKGEVIGILETLGIKYNFVTPQEWKTHFNLLKTEKNKAIDFVKQRFKNSQEILPKQKTKQSGVCDAVLIAKYFIEN